MAISDKRFLEARARGEVIVHPFRDEQLGTSSYDVCLGPFFYREQHPPLPGAIFNIYDPEHVAKVWGELQTAPTLEELRLNEPMTNLDPHDRIIMLAPGETILAHTEEFIGGRVQFTSMMKARSSFGRSFITVCKCLHPDTLVRRADGSEIKIRDVKVGDSLINADRFGRIRSARVKRHWTNAKAKSIMTVRTAGGREVTLAADHLCRVSTRNGVQILEARQLRVGDAMPVVKQLPAELTAMSNMTLDEAALLGYFVAEGHWDEYVLSFAKTVHKPEQRQEIVQLMTRVFPRAPRANLNQDSQITYCSVDFIREFTARFPEVCRLAGDKRLPPALLNTDDGVIREFLRTYMQCDAHMRKNVCEVELTSLSEGLIHDLIYLAARLGAAPTRFSKAKGSSTKHSKLLTRAHFTGEDAVRLGHPLKPLVAREWSVNISHLLSAFRQRRGLTVKQLGYDTSQGRGISRARLQDMYKRLGLNALTPYINDLVWDEIESIYLSPVLQPGFIDLSLDVESEDDALFMLSNGLMQTNCAGWGDVGYISRWTFEITNVSQHYRVPLVVGEPIAQIIIDETGPIRGDDYGITGSYQGTTDIEILINSWSPTSMLPRTKRKRRVTAPEALERINKQ